MGKGRWVESAITYLYLLLAAVMVVISAWSLFKHSWSLFPVVTICGIIYNLVQALYVYLEGGKHASLRAAGLLTLAVFCAVFTRMVILLH